MITFGMIFSVVVFDGVDSESERASKVTGMEFLPKA